MSASATDGELWSRERSFHCQAVLIYTVLSSFVFSPVGISWKASLSPNSSRSLGFPSSCCLFCLPSMSPRSR